MRLDLLLKFLLFFVIINIVSTHHNNNGDQGISTRGKKMIRRRRPEGNFGSRTTTPLQQTDDSEEIEELQQRPTKRSKFPSFRRAKQLGTSHTRSKLEKLSLAASTEIGSSVYRWDQDNTKPKKKTRGSRRVVKSHVDLDQVVEKTTKPYIPASSRGVQIYSRKEKPVETLNSFNQVQDDGSYTYGFVNEDGTFKTETRKDCIVKGKYGYVDPKGQKREYSYTSGTKCDHKDSNEEDYIEDKLSPKIPDEDSNRIATVNLNNAGTYVKNLKNSREKLASDIYLRRHEDFQNDDLQDDYEIPPANKEPKFNIRRRLHVFDTVIKDRHYFLATSSTTTSTPAPPTPKIYRPFTTTTEFYNFDDDVQLDDDYTFTKKVKKPSRKTTLPQQQEFQTTRLRPTVIQTTQVTTPFLEKIQKYEYKSKESLEVPTKRYGILEEFIDKQKSAGKIRKFEKESPRQSSGVIEEFLAKEGQPIPTIEYFENRQFTNVNSQLNVQPSEIYPRSSYLPRQNQNSPRPTAPSTYTHRPPVGFSQNPVKTLVEPTVGQLPDLQTQIQFNPQTQRYENVLVQNLNGKIQKLAVGNYNGQYRGDSGPQGGPYVLSDSAGNYGLGSRHEVEPVNPPPTTRINYNYNQDQNIAAAAAAAAGGQNYKSFPNHQENSNPNYFNNFNYDINSPPSSHYSHAYMPVHSHSYGQIDEFLRKIGHDESSYDLSI